MAKSTGTPFYNTAPANIQLWREFLDSGQQFVDAIDVHLRISLCHCRLRSNQARVSMYNRALDIQNLIGELSTTMAQLFQIGGC